MPLVRQVAHHPVGRLLIIGGEGGQVGEVKLPSRVGEQYAGDGDVAELRLEKLQIAPQEQDAQGLALPAQLDGVNHLVGVLVQVVDRGVLARVLEQLLAALHQLGKEHVHSALDDDGDGGAGLLLQVPGVGIGLEALLRHHRQHPAPGLLRYVGVVVEHPGHGGHTHAGQPGNILDGQAASLLFSRLFYPNCARRATFLFLAVTP